MVGNWFAKPAYSIRRMAFRSRPVDELPNLLDPVAGRNFDRHRIDDTKGTKAHYHGTECLITLENDRSGMTIGICYTISRFDTVNVRLVVCTELGADEIHALNHTSEKGDCKSTSMSST